LGSRQHRRLQCKLSAGRTLWNSLYVSTATSYLLTVKLITPHRVFRNGGQSAVSTLAQKISTALDMSKSYTVTLSFWPYEGDNRWGCSLNVYANDDRVLRRDVTNFPPVTPHDTPSYETHTSSSFIPATSDVTIRVEYTCTASGTSFILLDDVGLAPDQVSS